MSQKPIKNLTVNPEPKFSLSPDLYMQFMEPLGATDSSVEVAWDNLKNDWREDVIKTTRKLAPPIIRYGGCLSSYYRWREGVGPRNKRKPMKNLLWGGVETNQVGTHEFVDFCGRVGAKGFYCVNFEADGREKWARPGDGSVRNAGPAEAAAWVDYCNNPKNKERIANGAKKPFNLKLWQVGNETSYDPNGFDCETAAKKTVAFAKAMRKKDPDIKIIGWGDSGWAPRMLEVAGEHLDYIAFHNMFSAGAFKKGSPLQNNDWRADQAGAWKALMAATREPEEKLQKMRGETKDSGIPLALTECHFAIPGRNRNEILSTWAAGVANARILNVHERHGDQLKIATLADFCGNRWLVNAVMIDTPGKSSYLLPVARVMALYRKYSGTKFLTVNKTPGGLDVTASRKGKKIYLHVVNTSRHQAVKAKIGIPGIKVQSARAFEIAVDPFTEIGFYNEHMLEPVEKKMPKNLVREFPPASVTAVEIKTI